jgi:hypothetical protein
MGGGKGGSDNTTVMYDLMQQISGGQQQAHAPAPAPMPAYHAPQMPQAPPVLEMPDIVQPLEIDWTEKNSQLANKARADFHSSQASKKGRLDTVLTSPLADDDDVDVTQSLLTGS